MTPQEEEARGVDAQRILNDPIYREAYTTIRENIVSQLALADTADDRRKRLNDLLIALTKVEGYMKQVMATGTMAAIQIERERTLTERLMRRRA